MRDSLKKIEVEFENLFEFPTEDKSSVASTSCKLFAEKCVDNVVKQYESEIRDKNALIKDLFEKATNKRAF